MKKWFSSKKTDKIETKSHFNWPKEASNKESIRKVRDMYTIEEIIKPMNKNLNERDFCK